MGERAFEYGDPGLAALADWVLSMAIEVPRGPLVESLMERGLAVHAINPKQLDRFRDRISPAGAKDDRRNAWVLAAALPHVIRNQVDAAYACSDLFERRHVLMQQWADYLAGGSQRPADPPFSSARWPSRQRVSVAAVTPYLRLVASSSAPRNSSNTTVILRRADQRPFPRPPAAGAAPVAPRAPFAAPAPPFLPLDIACSSSPVAPYTGSQITVQRNRGAGDVAFPLLRPFGRRSRIPRS